MSAARASRTRLRSTKEEAPGNGPANAPRHQRCDGLGPPTVVASVPMALPAQGRAGHSLYEVKPIGTRFLKSRELVVLRSLRIRRGKWPSQARKKFCPSQCEHSKRPHSDTTNQTMRIRSNKRRGAPLAHLSVRRQRPQPLGRVPPPASPQLPDFEKLHVMHVHSRGVFTLNQQTPLVEN